ARVMDPANREISAANSVVATYGNYQISVQPDSYVYPMGQTAQANAVARDYDGNAGATKLHLEVRRWARQGKSRYDTPPEQERHEARVRARHHRGTRHPDETRR